MLRICSEIMSRALLVPWTLLSLKSLKLLPSYTSTGERARSTHAISTEELSPLDRRKDPAPCHPTLPPEAPRARSPAWESMWTPQRLRNHWYELWCSPTVGEYNGPISRPLFDICWSHKSIWHSGRERAYGISCRSLAARTGSWISLDNFTRGLCRLGERLGPFLGDKRRLCPRPNTIWYSAMLTRCLQGNFLRHPHQVQVPREAL